MMRRKRDWAAALAFSLAVHGGAAAMLMRGSGEEVQVAGGDRFEIALLGSAFEDAVSAGAPEAAVRPVEQAGETVEPLRPRPAVAVPPLPATQTLAPVPEPAPQHPVPPLAAAGPVETPAVEAARAPAAEPVPSETAMETVETAETVAALVRVPVPEARPAETAEPSRPVERGREAVEPVRETAGAPAATADRAQPRERAERMKQPPPPQPRQAGNGGRGRADARKGQPDGAERGSQAAAAKSASSREAGNAALSNYPGKVVSRLRRALRYPAEARRERLRGEVHVAFTVRGGGGVSGVRVVRSSGSPVLDRAALETVRRAVPFPPVPAGRSSWSFTVPLAFAR